MKLRSTCLTLRPLALLLVFALVIGACSSSNSNSKANSASTQSVGTAAAKAQSDANGSGGTLVIAMSAANIPSMDTSPTEGYEGYRFVGFQLYDGLTNFDSSQGDTVTVAVPALAEKYEISDDHLTWTFHLRPNVKFHDGTPWNAAALDFNIKRVMDTSFQYYSKDAASGAGFWDYNIDSTRVVDDMTFAITTKQPDSFLPTYIAHGLIASPDAIKKWGAAYAEHPAGTGPFKLSKLVPGQQVEFVPNKDYWGKVPKLDTLILRPTPEPSTRLAGLRSGEVLWAETPPPESVPKLKADGFQVLLKPYPHEWPWQLNLAVDSPWKNKLVRQAANYAIDRDGLCKQLLQGVCEPTGAYLYPGHAYYTDTKPFTYDPKKAKELLAQAGYPNGFKSTISISSSGSGQMWPPQMNDFIQQGLKAVGIDVTFDVREWNSLLTAFIAKDYGKDDGTNVSWAYMGPDQMVSSFHTGLNFTGYSNPQVDDLFDKARNSFDEKAQANYMTQAIKIVQDDSPWIWIVHDLNLRALSPRVHGFVPSQSWFAYLNNIWVSK
jgi:peptide/nickel transport system substrate-binding protein